MKTRFWIYLLLILSAISCREVYHPELYDTPKALVVEGLITDELRSHTIKISRALPFDSIGSVPETGAEVFIAEKNGELYSFDEIKPGKYASNPVKFKSKTGSSYTLTIRTKDGKVYKSSEQMLLPRKDFSDITNIRKTGKYSNVDEGKIVYFSVPGSQFITSLDLTSDNNPYYRFSSILLSQFVMERDTPKISYCWQKFNPDDYFNMNDVKYNSSGVFQHDLGFCPVDCVFYGIYTKELRLPTGATIKIYNTLDKFVISFKQYHLNKETYDYYKSLNRQLEAKQQIFDPIPFQSIGNLKCISDPEALVLGIFEVSAVSNRTFRINPVPQKDSFILEPINPVDMDTIVLSGKNPFLKPKTWIY